MPEKARDPRWIIITESGEWGLAGRHTGPSEDEISVMEANLVRQGAAGWLAIASGSFYSKGFPEIVMSRPLGSPCISFEAAIEALKARLRQHDHDSGGPPQP